MGNQVSSTIKIYSQNVSCDKISEKLIEKQGCEDMTFENRFKKILDGVLTIPHVDIIAFNEIRYKSNISFVEKRLTELGYDPRVFANNDSDLSFNNVLAVSRKSKWKIFETQAKWVASKADEVFLNDTHSMIEGDPHGRCAGVIYLEHRKNSNIKVCVLTSHVCPFGDVKTKQQNALFSMNEFNLAKNPKIPSIIVGDFNRFENENQDFQRRLKQYDLTEAKSNRLLIPDTDNTSYLLEIRENENIGTFNPWPSDEKIHDEKMKEPLKNSRLDVQLCSDNGKLVTIKEVFTRASMFKEVADLSEKPKERNDIRHRLHCNMASDHLAIVGTYEVKG